MIEAFLFFVAATLIAWKHMHPVFALLTGVAAASIYVLLFVKLFYLVIFASVAFWGYFGYWIGNNIFSGDQIWAVTFAVIGGMLAAIEKVVLRMLATPA